MKELVIVTNVLVALLAVYGRIRRVTMPQQSNESSATPRQWSVGKLDKCKIIHGLIVVANTHQTNEVGEQSNIEESEKYAEFIVKAAKAYDENQATIKHQENLLNEMNDAGVELRVTIKDLQERLEKQTKAIQEIIWILNVGIEREGSSECKTRIQGVLEDLIGASSLRAQSGDALNAGSGTCDTTESSQSLMEKQGKVIKDLVKALRYCAVDPRLLQPENNMQIVVASNALAKVPEEFL